MGRAALLGGRLRRKACDMLWSQRPYEVVMSRALLSLSVESTLRPRSISVNACVQSAPFLLGEGRGSAVGPLQSSQLAIIVGVGPWAPCM